MIFENKKDLKSFLNDFKTKDCIIIPIKEDTNKHPQQTGLSLLYFDFFGKEYVLPINHNESINIDLPNLKSNTKKYTNNKNKLLHLLDLENVIDVNMIHYMKSGEPIDFEECETNAHSFLNMKYYKKTDVNTVIPILKHVDRCRRYTKILKDIIEKSGDYVNMSYNDEVSDNLLHIEKNGLMTTTGYVFSEYNLFTSTGRPSNRFGGINFAALNKKDGSRERFISRYKNGVLVEMDFDAYHLRLIADKIDYEFPQGSVHEHMAKFYGVSYEEAKGLSFQYLYGHIPQDVIEINPYFFKVNEYIQGLWNIYKNNDFIESDIYKRQIFKRNLKDMNANKLFNYTIQLMETENNMKALSALIPKLTKYETKLILYSYDSFLFDFNMSDGLDCLKEIKTTLEQEKYPVKVSWGINYHEMKDITERFK